MYSVKQAPEPLWVEEQGLRDHTSPYGAQFDQPLFSEPGEGNVSETKLCPGQN